MTDDAPAAPVVIIGIGSTMRRDDGLGPMVIDLLSRHAALDSGSVELQSLDGEPTRMIDAWRGRRLAIVVDAVRKGSAAGACHRIAVGDGEFAGWSPPASSHSVGIAEAVSLGRALDRMPGRLVVFGIEPADVSPGEGLSAHVEAAVPLLLEDVIAEATT